MKPGTLQLLKIDYKKWTKGFCYNRKNLRSRLQKLESTCNYSRPLENFELSDRCMVPLI